jgi:electron transport complex protein RnfC
MARIGTPFQHAIDSCGGLVEGTNILVMGGPMMGLTQWTTDVPIIKGTSGILAWKEPKLAIEFTCIRCGRCVEHCPMGLVPTQLMKSVKYEQLESAESWGVLDCVECGCCQYSCPAKIPLVHWIRLGKNQVTSLKRKKSS